MKIGFVSDIEVEVFKAAELCSKLETALRVAKVKGRIAVRDKGDLDPLLASPQTKRSIEEIFGLYNTLVSVMNNVRHIASESEIKVDFDVRLDPRTIRSGHKYRTRKGQHLSWFNEE